MKASMAKKSKLSATPTSKELSRLSLFGSPLILEGEDSAAYDELLARVSRDMKPADIVEEIWIRDIVDLTWEIFRWRRLKTALFSAAVPGALTNELAPLMRRKTTETDGMSGFPSLDLSFLPRPPSPAYKLAKKWSARNPTAIKQVNKLMASANVTMDAVLAQALVKEFDHIERIDRLVTIAEGRRNAVLREIDRRRAIFAQAMRETVQNVEDAEFEIVNQKIITSKKDTDKNAA
jgi:hypothetical protein